MKRKLAAVLAGTMALTLAFTGCQGKTGLETAEIKIEQYKGVEVAQVEKPAEITDEEIDSAMNDVLTANAQTAEITDRAVESGDTVNIDFVGKIDGKEFDGGSAEGYSLVIGSGVFIEGFEDSVIGHKVGDKYDWNGKFPEDYTEELSGQDVTFTITVNSISTEEVPELTDEFVQSVSEESKTVEEFREETKRGLEETYQSEYNATLASAVWEKILEKTEVKKYPEGRLEEIQSSVIEQYAMIAEQYYGIDYETLVEEQMGSTVEEFEKEVAAYAEQTAMQELAVEAIAEEENIKLDEDAFEAELEKMAEENMYASVEEFKEAFEEEELRKEALANLVDAWLVEHCVQVAE